MESVYDTDAGVVSVARSRSKLDRAELRSESCVKSIDASSGLRVGSNEA
jgi:hypothetical protein